MKRLTVTLATIVLLGASPATADAPVVDYPMCQQAAALSGFVIQRTVNTTALRREASRALHDGRIRRAERLLQQSRIWETLYPHAPRYLGNAIEQCLTPVVTP